jgi:hypothetical protein
MGAGQIIAYIVIPLAIFFLSAAAAGITALVKGVTYMSRSQAAQESTAATNHAISTKLDKYIEQTDHKFTDHDVRLSILEDRKRRQ